MSVLNTIVIENTQTTDRTLIDAVKKHNNDIELFNSYTK